MTARTRGVAAGLAILTLGPLVVAAAGSHPAARIAATPSTRAVAADIVLTGRPRPALVGDPELIPEVTPAPPPPAPVVQPAAVASQPQAVTPHAAPAPQAPPPAPGTIEAIIQDAANRWGVSYPWMLKIARCESGLNPRAYNPAGPYIGLFQFLASTFRANGGTDIYDPADQSNIAAKMLAHGQAHQWGCA